MGKKEQEDKVEKNVKAISLFSLSDTSPLTPGPLCCSFKPCNIVWGQPRLQRLAATPNPVCSALQLSVRREMNLHRNRKLVRSVKEGADNKSKFKPADGVTFLLLTASTWILANYLLPDRVCLWDVSLGLTGFFFSFVGSSFLSDRMEICS